MKAKAIIFLCLLLCGCKAPPIDADVTADADIAANADVLSTNTSATTQDQSGGDNAIIVGPIAIQGGAWLTAVTGAIIIVCVFVTWRWRVNKRKYVEITKVFGK